MHLRDKDQALADILRRWLERPDEDRTEGRMLGFAFDVSTDPAYRFAMSTTMYPIVREHLRRHGNLTDTAYPLGIAS